MVRKNQSLRRVPAALLLSGALVLAGCSDDGGSDDPTPTATPKKATDEEKLADLALDFWAVRTSSQNAGNDDPAQFAGITSPRMTEVEVSRLKRYEKLGVKRMGKPEVTEVEATAGGTEGFAVMCLNEDGWGVKVEGDPDFKQPDNGTVAFGFAAEKDDDGRWLVTETLSEKDKRVRAKKC